MKTIMNTKPEVMDTVVLTKLASLSLTHLFECLNGSVGRDDDLLVLGLRSDVNDARGTVRVTRMVDIPEKKENKYASTVEHKRILHFVNYSHVKSAICKL